jgi:hypothetical protein
MKRSRLFTLFAAGLFLWPTLSASAASEQADGEQLHKLVKDLKTAMQRAEDNKTADAKFLRELRDIIRLYETSELVELLFEDFQDGDYTASPAWVVDSRKKLRKLITFFLTSFLSFEIAICKN